jgi:hypothetical protein
MEIKALELILIVVVVFGLGFWQLSDVNKALKKDGDRSSRKDRSRRTETDTEAASHRDTDM